MAVARVQSDDESLLTHEEKKRISRLLVQDGDSEQTFIAMAVLQSIQRKLSWASNLFMQKE